MASRSSWDAPLCVIQSNTLWHRDGPRACAIHAAVQRRMEGVFAHTPTALLLDCVGEGSPWCDPGDPVLPYGPRWGSALWSTVVADGEPVPAKVQRTVATQRKPSAQLPKVRAWLPGVKGAMSSITHRMELKLSQHDSRFSLSLGARDDSRSRMPPRSLSWRRSGSVRWCAARTPATGCGRRVTSC